MEIFLIVLHLKVETSGITKPGPAQAQMYAQIEKDCTAAIALCR